MLFKSTLAIAFVALTSMVSASTPACVLSVMGGTNNPDDLPSICTSKTIQASIEKQCGDNADAGLKFFSNQCKANGFTVADTTSSSSATTTGSGANSTGSGFITAVSSAGSQSTGSSTSGSKSGSASGSASASASPSPSTAGASSQQLSGTTFVAAMFLGAAALL